MDLIQIKRSNVNQNIGRRANDEQQGSLGCFLSTRRAVHGNWWNSPGAVGVKQNTLPTETQVSTFVRLLVYHNWYAIQ